MSQLDDDIVIHPVKTGKDPEIPKKGVIFVNPGEAKHALAAVTDNGGTRHFLHNSELAITADKSRFIAGPAIGAPMAALVMEKLIALGASHIVLMGWCGAIDQQYRIGDMVIPSGAVSGEGTSRYYSTDKQPDVSLKVMKFLRSLLLNNKIDWKEGNIWSTDAPYRESRDYLAQINLQKNVVGVDMEFSALCSVASFRNIDFGAVLLVSDEVWGNSWKPGFRNSTFKNRSKTLIKLLCES